MRAYVGTMNGVYRLDEAGERAEPLGLDGSRVWAIGAWAGPAGDVVLAGTYGEGMFRSEDGGRNWRPADDGLSVSHFRAIQRDPAAPETVLAGTEPGRLFRSTDGGRAWRELTGFAAVPESAKWYLPYSPRAGATRNVYFPADQPGMLLASVEVGGTLASYDGGDRWEYLIGPNEDNHFITGDPAFSGRLYAAMGYAGLSTGGVLRSDDGGRTWRRMLEGYTRAVIVPPGRSDALLASPGPRVGRDALLRLSEDGGETWRDVSDGIATPMPDMVEVFHADPAGRIWGVCAGGRLIRATPGEWRWQTIDPFGETLPAQSVAFVG